MNRVTVPGLAARALAALRLPPIPCGCTDPRDRDHHHHPAYSAQTQNACYRCSAVGLEALAYRATEPDPRCRCARALGVVVGGAA
ncbi:MAG: hypothetical protein R2737_07840 [Candidatus Nanopelagicales bacterium]